MLPVRGRVVWDCFAVDGAILLADFLVAGKQKDKDGDRCVT
jgi:hypothetical protein